MNEFLELLYVTGILEEESIEISNNDYIQKGIRIQTLAREKQMRLCKETKDRTVRSPPCRGRRNGARRAQGDEDPAPR